MNIIPAAMQMLEVFAVPGSFRSSRLWRTSPVDCAPDAEEFLNAAVSFNAVADLTPEDLLVSLKEIEIWFGRRRQLERNAPRELDLDLLIFDEHTRESEWFTLPHPRAVDRLFVLAPAAEIVPGLIWPGLNRTVKELLDALETDEQAIPVVDTAARC